MNDLEDKNNQNVLASPKARKFARELGVDVRDVVGSKRLGRETQMIEFIFTLPTTLGKFIFNFAVWAAGIYYAVEWVKDTLKDKGYL